MNRIIAVIIAIILIVAVGVGAPFAFVWALNVLFPVLAIPYTWTVWMAVSIVWICLGATVRLGQRPPPEYHVKNTVYARGSVADSILRSARAGRPL